MSDDKTRLQNESGPQPRPIDKQQDASRPKTPSGSNANIKPPHEETFVVPAGLGRPGASQPPRNTLVGVGAKSTNDPTIVLGSGNPAVNASVLPSGAPTGPAPSIAQGTPPPGATPLVAPPQAQTVASSRAKRSSVAGTNARSSQWDSFEGVSTAVHATSAAPHPGVRINQYEIIKVLGEGGMGTVFLARDLRLGRRVAIKFLQSNEPALTQRFLVEARTTARCQHDNIVVIYEVGEHMGAPYIVLEFLNGKPLTFLTQNSGKWTRARSKCSTSASRRCCRAAAARWRSKRRVAFVCRARSSSRPERTRASRVPARSWARSSTCPPSSGASASRSIT
jgi:hypothetical protein